MPLIQCLVCRSQVAHDASPCPVCATRDPSGAKQRSLRLKRAIGAVVVLVAGAYLILVQIPLMKESPLFGHVFKQR